MFVAQGFGALVGGAVAIYAVRSLSQSAWGEYSTALALVAMFTVLSGLGVAQLALREMAEDLDRQQTVLSRSLGALLVTSGVALVALLPTVIALGYGLRVVVLVALLAPFLLLEPGLSLAQAAFNARRWLAPAAKVQLVRWGVFGTLAVAAIAAGTGVTGVAVASSIGLMASVSAAVMTLRRGLALHPRVRFEGAAGFARAAIPVAGISVAGILYDRLDVVMVSKLSSVSAVASYSVPYGFVRLSWIIPSIVAAAFFPVFSKALAENKEEARRLFVLVARFFLLTALPLSLLLAVGSPTLLSAVFGGRYASSQHVLEIMAWTSVLGFQNYVLWYAIFAIRRERLVLVLQIAGLALNALLNLFMIPRFGPSGAAASLLGSDLFIVAGQAVVVHRHLFRLPLAALLAKPAAVSLVIVPLAVAGGRAWSPVGAGSVGAALYVLLMLGASYIGASEWRPFAEAAGAAAGSLRRRSRSTT